MIRPSLRRGRGPAAPRSGKDDDTGPGCYGTPPGGIWRPPPSRAAGPRRRTRRPFRAGLCAQAPGPTCCVTAEGRSPASGSRSLPRGAGRPPAATTGSRAAPPGARSTAEATPGHHRHPQVARPLARRGLRTGPGGDPPRANCLRRLAPLRESRSCHPFRRDTQLSWPPRPGGAANDRGTSHGASAAGLLAAFEQLVQPLEFLPGQHCGQFPAARVGILQDVARVAPFEEPEVSQALANVLRGQGATIHAGASRACSRSRWTTSRSMT
jgi:hypothetical protein